MRVLWISFILLLVSCSQGESNSIEGIEGEITIIDSESMNLYVFNDDLW
ncbi:hypothetical protein ACOI1C_16220 [Bacillus sp. DJP31]